MRSSSTEVSDGQRQYGKFIIGQILCDQDRLADIVACPECIGTETSDSIEVKATILPVDDVRPFDHIQGPAFLIPVRGPRRRLGAEKLEVARLSLYYQSLY
jgi:hypothetical protein